MQRVIHLAYLRHLPEDEINPSEGKCFSPLAINEPEVTNLHREAKNLPKVGLVKPTPSKDLALFTENLSQEVPG